MPSVPHLSILTPVWNGLPFVRECVESVIAQDGADWEMLIADNGSTDGTREYLATLDDPRIKVTFHESNRGIFGNLNFLLEQSSGQFAYLLCADDTFVPGAIRRVADFWGSAPGDVAYVRFNFSEDRVRRMKSLAYTILPRLVEPTVSDFYYFLTGCIPGNLSNNSLRVAAAREVGGFRTDFPYAGDYEFWSRVGARFPWAISEESTAEVRRHSGVASVYLNRNGELAAQNTRVRAMLFDRIKESYPPMLLRLHATWRFLPLMEMGLIQAFRRRSLVPLAAVRAAFRPAMHLSPVLAAVLYVGSAGGRIFRHATTRLLLRVHETRPANIANAGDRPAKTL